MTAFRRIGAAILVVAASCASGHPAAAQGVRATASTTARYVEIRPVTRDTVPRSLVTERPDGTFEFDGHPVFCTVAQSCVFYRSVDVEHATSLTQDADVTAWGLGLPGLSVTAAVRGRARLNGDFVWPRSDDEFDALLAYAEYDREPFRFRLGRQRTAGGLGFSGFDGASIMVEPSRRVSLEWYGGRSLARALYEPRNDALRGVEDFVPDRDAYLVGAWAEVEPLPATVIALRYQREIWSDRSALLSERASLDVRTDLAAPVNITAGADYDFAFGRIGKAHLTARLPVSRFSLEASGRRYVPYFELWTIWGFFSPVGYHEAELQVSWRARDDLSVWAAGGWRRYEDAQAPIILRKLADESTRLGIGASYRAPGDVLLLGEYQMERGFGAYLSSADVSARWQPHARIAATVAGTAFQQIEQFRIGEGVVLGASAAVDVDITRRVALGAGLSLYRQAYDNRPALADWNQCRGWASLRVVFGNDPRLPGKRP